MQETHIDENLAKAVEMEWGGTALWAYGKSNARGVGVLINNRLQFQIMETYVDKDGRMLIIQIKIENQNYVIMNLYAPNKDSPDFFQTAFDKIMQFDGKKIIVGDFNTVLNNGLDRISASNKQCNNDNSAAVINNFIENTGFEDIWRVRHGGKTGFTWSKLKPTYTASRLDYFLTEISLAASIKKADIKTSIKSDHKAVRLIIEPHDLEQGPGIWKLNTRLLYEPDYVSLINSVIESAKEWSRNMSGQDRWEAIKQVVIVESQDFSRARASEKRVVISALEQAVEDLQNKIDSSFNEHEYKLLKKTQLDLEAFQEEYAQGVIFRSKANWYEAGEKCTKYFLNLEKSRAASKGMSAVIDSSGKVIYSCKEILKMQHAFYKELYTSDPHVQFSFTPPDNMPKLTDEMKLQLQKQIEIKEVRSAITQMARGKTPGADGLPIEWYIVFWEQIKDLYMEMIATAYEEGRLHDTANIGIISLIPKKDKDVRYIKNLRPISLLNADYKIIEKVLANRIKEILVHIIHDNQKGFLAGRHIAVNIRKILDIIQHVEANNLPGIILSADFQKAFDRVELNSLYGAMRIFEFPEEYIKWIQILYKDAHSRINNRGFLSDPIPITRSLRQGAPNSAYLFLIIAEIFATSIRMNKKITGFPINELQDLLGQFADDTDLFLNGSSQRATQEVLSSLDSFYNISGMKVNYDKTTLYRIGSLKNSQAKWYTEQEVSWKNGTINVLGVEVGGNGTDLGTLNYGPILSKAQAIMQNWSKRNISLMGKIQIVNSLVGSLFVYKMYVLPKITQGFVIKFNKMVENFLWNGRKPKIPLKILQNSKKYGGLNLVDLEVKDDAIKISWIKMVSEDKYLRELAFQQISPHLKERIFRCNIKESDIITEFKPSFWRDVLIAWSKLSFQEQNLISTKDEILAQSIWYNSHIKVNGRVTFFKKAFDKGLFTLFDLLQDDYQPLSHQELTVKFDLSVMQVNSILDAIPKDWKKLLFNVDLKVFPERSKYDRMICKKKIIREAYHELTTREDLLFSRYVKMQTMLQTDYSYADFLKLFRNIKLITNYVKLRSFQYRMLCNSIVTNKLLFKWKVISSENCTFCDSEPETIQHLFFHCCKITPIWLKVKEYCKQLTNKDDIDLTANNVILNKVHPQASHVYNFVVLAVKLKIYTNRCITRKINVDECLAFVNSCQRIEKYNAVKNGKMYKHIQKWEGKTINRPQNMINDITIENYAQQYIVQINDFQV